MSFATQAVSRIKGTFQKPLANVCFAYNNYINYEYKSDEVLQSRIKSVAHLFNELKDRPRISVAHDFDKCNALIKKGYYVLSLTNSKITSVEKIKDIYIKKDYASCSQVFLDTGSDLKDRQHIHVIVKSRWDIARVAKQVDLPKTDEYKDEILERFNSIDTLVHFPKISDIWTLDQDNLLIKGSFSSIKTHNDLGEEFGFFGVYHKNKKVLLVEDFHELKQALLIDGKYCFVTYWQMPECGKRGAFIFTLENGSLKEAFKDRSDST